VPIPFFGPAQTDAFIPALTWFLVATAFAVIPFVLAPILARMRLGRSLTVTAVVLAVLALVPAGFQAAQAFATLGAEHAVVQTTMADRYGVPLSADAVGSLLEGGKVKPAGFAHTIHLEAVAGAPGQYAPVEAVLGPLPAR
jgi:NADH:ubiquinone oxidoreductase subunit H